MHSKSNTFKPGKLPDWLTHQGQDDVFHPAQKKDLNHGTSPHKHTHAVTTPSCQKLSKILVKVWSKLSGDLGAVSHGVPPSPDLKKILQLINLYLKLSQGDNLSHLPIKHIAWRMYKILSRNPDIDIPDSHEFPGEPDFPDSRDEPDLPDEHEDIPYYPDSDDEPHFPDELDFTDDKDVTIQDITEPSHYHLSQEYRQRLIRLIMTLYRQHKHVPNRVLKPILMTLLFEIVPDLDKPHDKCEQRAVLNLFKRVSDALKSYLNREECGHYKLPLRKTQPDTSDLINMDASAKHRAASKEELVDERVAEGFADSSEEMENVGGRWQIHYSADSDEE